MTCAVNPVMREMNSQMRSAFKQVVRARYATRIAGPNLNSNFDRQFLPILHQLAKTSQDLVRCLNSGELENLSDGDVLFSINSHIRPILNKLNKITNGCTELDLHRNPTYAAIVADLEHRATHIERICESLMLSTHEDYVTALHDAVLTLQAK